MIRETAPSGVWLHGDCAGVASSVETVLNALDLSDLVVFDRPEFDGERYLRISLKPDVGAEWLPAFDTVGLQGKLSLDTEHSAAELEREIAITLLDSPQGVQFPSVNEWVANIHMRRNIVIDGRKTALNFDTEAAERPSDSWCYDEERGFTVRSGCSLIEALRQATQPDASGKTYSFSCYRATEYVILLAIAEELAVCNPALLEKLQRQCEFQVIRSGLFHEVFLHEYGTQERPFPERFYVPGDRVWFRNPDAISSDVTGFEGSWVLYLGGGRFTNFWKRDRPYALADKCLEIYHWRHGVSRNEAGELVMDETRVEERVAETLQNPDEVDRIMKRMMRWRDPKGVYADGGCVDTTRESPRWICPGTANMHLPPH